MWKYSGRTIKEHKAWTDDNGITHPRNWHIWSPSEKAAAGGQKCDALPLEPGCEGKAVRNILAVLIRGTESGQKYFQNNEEEVGRVYNTAIYNDQWLKIVSNILGNGTDEEKQLLNNFLKTKSIRKYRDPLMLYIDKIAKEKLNLTESLKRSKIPLYNSPVHPLYEQRLRTLNKKLMENKNVIK